MADEKTVRYDIGGDGALTQAIMELLNSFPGLKSGDSIKFNTLATDKGKAMFPSAGAVIMNERRDILGGIHQECAYPFFVYYRASRLNEERRQYIKEWLDSLALWLDRQTVTFSGVYHKLENYPELSGGRRFRTIQATAPALFMEPYENGAEDCVIAITATYYNDFKR